MRKLNIVVVPSLASVFSLPEFNGTFNNEVKCEFIASSVAESAAALVLRHTVDYDFNEWSVKVLKDGNTDPATLVTVMRENGFNGAVPQMAHWDIPKIEGDDLISITMEESLLVVLCGNGFMLVKPQNWESILATENPNSYPVGNATVSGINSAMERAIHYLCNNDDKSVELKFTSMGATFAMKFHKAECSNQWTSCNMDYFKGTIKKTLSTRHWLAANYAINALIVEAIKRDISTCPQRHDDGSARLLVDGNWTMELVCLI